MLKFIWQQITVNVYNLSVNQQQKKKEERETETERVIQLGKRLDTQTHTQTIRDESTCHLHRKNVIVH